MKKITLTNSFHGTSINVMVPKEIAEQENQYEAWLWLQIPKSSGSRQKLNRVKNALCGISDCQCGVVR